jgi:IclR family acetate operon transcriptional repressor
VSMDAVQSVERALDLLEFLAQSVNKVGISELSIATGQPVATVHRLLKTLTARGYVTRDSRTRRYAPGPAAHALASMDHQMMNWTEIAASFLRELVEISGETANVVLLERDRAVYVAQAQPTRMVRMFTELGNRVPLHSSGCGKVLLAYQSESIVNAIIAQSGLQAFTAMTITDPDRLRQELATIRQQGYAIDSGEQEEGVRCVAVPVYGPKGKVVAAMSISGPSSRLENSRTPGLLPHLKRISDALTSSLTEMYNNDGQVLI